MNIKHLALASVLLMLTACASSTVGPGAGVAEAPVKGSVSNLNMRAQNVFQQMNIQSTGSSSANAGNEQQLTGRLGDSDITVRIDRQDANTSNVKVQASKNFVSGQQDVAKEILDKIVQQS